ncbi:MAG: D-alanyl-D-alanine carboxypeptidase family protein [Desulfotomaculales bacterium]
MFSSGKKVCSFRLPVLPAILFCAYLALALFAPGVAARAGETAEASPGPPAITGEAAVLMDARTGQVLFAKNEHKKMYPASTTKILTALVILERVNPAETVRVPEEASRTEGSAIGLQAGEELSCSDLLYALLLASANDAAVTLAVHAAGSVENFAALMNAKARSLGASESHFTNPHGLPDPDHYTTASDLALITLSAMRNPAFREIVGTETKAIKRPLADRSRGVPQEDLWNHNRLLESYQGATGVKTGYTDEAGQCLVASAERDGRELIAVVLKSEGSAVYEDARKMLDYGFEQFLPVRLVKKGDRLATLEVAGGEPARVDLVAGDDFWYDFPRAEGEKDLNRHLQLVKKVEAPLAAGQVAGELVFYDRERQVGQVDLVAAQAVARVRGKTWLYWLAGALLFFFCLRIKRNGRRRRKWKYTRPRRPGSNFLG